MSKSNTNDITNTSTDAATVEKDKVAAELERVRVDIHKLHCDLTRLAAEGDMREIYQPKPWHVLAAFWLGMVGVVAGVNAARSFTEKDKAAA